MLGHDCSRSGATSVRLQPPFERKWYRLFPDEGIQSGVQPVIASGRVFLGTLAGRLHAMDTETGEDVWVFQAGGPILHAAAVDEDRVFFGSGDGLVQAVSASRGKLLWSVPTDVAVWNAPAVFDECVFVGTRDGRLLALETATGKTRWAVELGAPILNSPAVDAERGRVYVGAEDLRVRAFTVKEGRLVWTSDRLPGAGMRGYHPVIAPDGAVMVTTSPVAGYDRFQDLLLDMVREVFGDFASWRHTKDENARLRAENFELMEQPETYRKQLDYLRRRLTREPAFQTFFVLDPATGRQRFVAPIVASESMNGPGAPPVVAPDGRVLVKYQVLLRSRYEHYSPYLNIGALDTVTGHITPVMNQTRTYGWHESLLLVHDEQCQLTVAGNLLLNAHQDNVNALDLKTLEGYSQPFAWNIHEPAPGEALTLRLAALREDALPPGNEWLIRGTAVYGGGSVLDTAVAVAGDSFYYLPSHELNSGCALIAYRSSLEARPSKRPSMPRSKPAPEEWDQIQKLPWDWDSLAHPRLKNLLEALPGPVPGTAGAPLATEASRAVASLTDSDLDRFIWESAWDPARVFEIPPDCEGLAGTLRGMTRELISETWRPLVMPAGKAPKEANRHFSDPSQTLYTLLLARPFLDPDLLVETDRYLKALVEDMPRTFVPDVGRPREAYHVPTGLLLVAEEPPLDGLARLYPLWLWSRTSAGEGFLGAHWAEFRGRLDDAATDRPDRDCDNARLAGLMAYCRMAKAMDDLPALESALPLTRAAMRTRLAYEIAHPRGGLIGAVPRRGPAFVRWRHLTPDVAKFLAAHAQPISTGLMAQYVDALRPGWWIAWNVEQLMRNEVPFQSPSTPLEIFTARALLLREPPEELSRFVDLPWCRADEYHIRKLALTLAAASQ